MTSRASTTLRVMLALPVFVLGPITPAPRGSGTTMAPPAELAFRLKVYLASKPPGSFRTFANGIRLQSDAPVPVTRTEAPNVCDQGQTQAVITTWAAHD